MLPRHLFNIFLEVQNLCQKMVIHNLKNLVWACDQLRTFSFGANGVGLKNQITMVMLKRSPTNSVSEAKSCTNFHFHKKDVT